MRVLQVVPNFGGGGVHAVARTLQDSLKTCHDMHLLSLMPPQSTDRIDANLHTLEPKQLSTGLPLLDRLVSYWNRSRSLRRLVKHIQPDLILAHSLAPTTMAALHLRKFRFVSVIHGALYADLVLDLEGSPLKRGIIRYGLARATAVIGVSEGILADVNRITKERVRTQAILNGLVHPPSAPEHTNDRSARLGRRFIFLGRLELQKNPLVLPEIFDRSIFEDYQIQLVILGDGSQRSDLLSSFHLNGVMVHQREPASNECGVFVPGFIQNPLRYLDTNTVLISTSLWEGFGLNILEAALQGSSIISTDCPYGPREIRNHLTSDGADTSRFHLVQFCYREGFTRTTLDEFRRLVTTESKANAAETEPPYSEFFETDSWIARWAKAINDLARNQ